MILLKYQVSPQEALRKLQKFQGKNPYNIFVAILVQMMTPKIPFEINRPLKKIAKKMNEQMIDLDDISNNSETEEELENRIKKFDFAAMIFSFIFFIIFASLYWIILLL